MVVERSADRLPIALDEAIRSERAHLGVEHLGVNSITVHRRKPSYRIVIAGIAPRFHVPVLHRDLAALSMFFFLAGLCRGCVVERVAQSVRDAFADDI